MELVIWFIGKLPSQLLVQCLGLPIGLLFLLVIAQAVVNSSDLSVGSGHFN